VSLSGEKDTIHALARIAWAGALDLLTAGKPITSRLDCLPMAANGDGCRTAVERSPPAGSHTELGHQEVPAELAPSLSLLRSRLLLAAAALVVPRRGH
jgi:hypothetical protein